MKFKLNKKGSHVGLVMSFLIFIVFLSFLRIILEDVERELIISASETITSTTIKLEGFVSSNCIILNNFIENFEFDNKIIVRDEENKIVQAFISSENSNNLHIIRDNPNQDFFKISNSWGFEPSNPFVNQQCEIVEEGEYIIGTTIKRDYLFEKNMVNLISRYSAMPRFEGSSTIVSIGILFDYGNGTEIKTRERNVTTDIFIKEIPIEYIDRDGNLLPGKLSVRVW
jgi:hypothetical protein